MHSERLERALQASIAAHAGQLRKGGGVPYVVHPLHAALVLARLGHGEDELVAALLHDVVEDADGWSGARVADEFGAEVAAIVAELTEDKSRSWEERKRDGIERAARMSPAAASVKAADVLHNLATLAHDLRAARDPAEVWSRFKGGRERTLAMTRELVDALAPRVEPRLASALREALSAAVAADRPA